MEQDNLSSDLYGRYFLIVFIKIMLKHLVHCLGCTHKFSLGKALLKGLKNLSTLCLLI